VDYQGGQGNGSAWFCDDFSAPVLMTNVYSTFSNKRITDIDVADIKTAIAACYPSAQTAPTLNYLYWLLTLKNGTA
jgi:hypothetical protein